MCCLVYRKQFRLDARWLDHAVVFRRDDSGRRLALSADDLSALADNFHLLEAADSNPDVGYYREFADELEAWAAIVNDQRRRS
jgi:hypothetical protein